MLANVGSSTMLPNSGIRGIISGDAFGFRAFKSGSEGTAGMTDFGESVFFTNPAALTSTQLQPTLDGKKGFDYITLVTSSSAVALKPLTVNFSNTAAQTITENGKTLKVANFEGIDLTDGNDSFVGFNGDNTVWAGKGTDNINGGGISNFDGNGGSTDRDWVTYASGGGNQGDKGIVLSTNSSGVMSVIDHGGATDTLTNVEAVHGTWLNDRFSGGTGTFNQIFSGLKGADTIDGGTGRDDRVWHNDDPAGVVVNLSSASVNTRSVEALVKSVKYAGASDVGPLLMIKEALDGVDTPAKVVASNRALDGWGTTDVLTSIEAAQGSQYDDQLYGSNARNILSGSAGFDFIVGNGGDDYLVGGYGNDVLHGGLGRDWLVMDELNWGALSANYATRFNRDLVDEGNLVVYKSVNESGLGLKADVLDGFILDNDLLDLSAIDANTKRAGNQQFDSTIITTNFTKKAGQLKISTFTGMVDNHNYSVSNAATGYKLNGVELQGDVNGDGLADFGIRLVGADFNVTSTNTLSLIANRLSITDSILF
jgi:Ca2+-binding RTX toxin-like protein